MRVEVFAQAADFAAVARDFLLGDEANHTFLLNRLARGDQDPERGPWWAAAVFDDQRLLACAARDRQAVFVSVGAVTAWPALVQELRGCEWLQHVIGDRAAALAAAAALGRRWHVHVDLPLLRLTRPPDAGPAPPPGTFLRAGPQHEAVLVEWSLAFHDEAGMVDPRANVPQLARRRLALGELYVWLDVGGEPACLAGGFLIPPRGARVAPVYTPPERRGRGYARALVAALCRELRQGGATSIFLFTDAANPTSNALYRRIGFEPCGRHLHLTLATAS